MVVTLSISNHVIEVAGYNPHYKFTYLCNKIPRLAIMKGRPRAVLVVVVYVHEVLGAFLRQRVMLMSSNICPKRIR